MSILNGALTALGTLFITTTPATHTPQQIVAQPHKEVRATTATTVKNTARDRILARWKRKQSALWATLHHETFTANVSAYTAAADECGKSDGITASGVRVQAHRTLACPPQYPFGAKVHIEGLGTFVCEDRGGAIKGNRFDVYMRTKKEAFAFGRRALKVSIVQ